MSGFDETAGPHQAGRTVLMELDQLRVDVLLVRSGLDAGWVEHLMTVRDSWPPVVVAADGIVVDGLHRLEAARRLGMSTIPAYLSTSHTPVEILVEAAQANASHGARLTRTERTAVARRLIAEASEFSDRKIARIAGMSPTTIGKYRRDARSEMPPQRPDRAIPPTGRSVQLDGDGVQLDRDGVQLDGSGRRQGRRVWLRLSRLTGLRRRLTFAFRLWRRIFSAR